jgi:hypothetical protein
MSIFTFLLDALFHHVYALLKEIDPEKASDMKEFKCTVAAQHLQLKPVMKIRLKMMIWRA